MTMEMSGRDTKNKVSGLGKCLTPEERHLINEVEEEDYFSGRWYSTGR